MTTSAEMTEVFSIVACLTSHNRCAVTVDALECLERAACLAGVTLSAVLTDDGSTDATVQQVLSRFAWVSIISGNGDLFWNRGMHLAMSDGLKRDVDAILWLNDDTKLVEDSLLRLVATAASIRRVHGRDGIIVGATYDYATGRQSYGGNVVASRWRPVTFRRVYSASNAIECDTMNGNVVLIPMAVALDMGNLDPVFEHAMGDLDYGLRAKRRGHPIHATPGFVGYCTNNPIRGTHRDKSTSLADRWRRVVHRKELPPRSWKVFTRRHGGPLWPIYFAWPYVRVLLNWR